VCGSFELRPPAGANCRPALPHSLQGAPGPDGNPQPPQPLQRDRNSSLLCHSAAGKSQLGAATACAAPPCRGGAAPRWAPSSPAPPALLHLHHSPTACCCPAVTFGKEAGVDGGQQGFAPGVWVYDNTHKAGRGWGRIVSAGEPHEDGTPVWRVDFQRGKRCTAIKQPYLQLPCVSYDERTAPTAAGQRVKVAAGHDLGAEGETLQPTTTDVRRPCCTAAPHCLHAQPPAPPHPWPPPHRRPPTPRPPRATNAPLPAPAPLTCRV